MIGGRKTVFAAAAFMLFTWVLAPIATYHEGTAINVESTVLREPFHDGDDLVYDWSGEIIRSCPIQIKRYFVDSKNVITSLTTITLPADDLGRKSVERRLPVPLRMAEGPAQYHAVEYPQCSLLQRLFRPSVAYPVVEFTAHR